MYTNHTTEPRPVNYGYSPDPCPKCGIAQRDHWKCSQCGARGHAIPRDTPFSAYCRWCADEARERQSEVMQ